MVIITRAQCPTETASEVGLRFREIPDSPEWIERKGPYISSNLSGGILGITVYELEESDLARGMEYLTKNMTIFYGIPGFKYDILPCFHVEEALKMIGI